MNCQIRHIDGLGQKSGIVLFSRWSDFCRLREVVLNHRETDAIHDLRVASRRLRAAFMLFAPYLSGTSTKKLSNDVREITRALGDVRNLDEALLYVQALTAPPPGMISRLETTRKIEIRRVTRILKKFSCHDRDEMLRKALAKLSTEFGGRNSDRNLQAYFSETSLRRYQQVRGLLHSANEPEQVAGRHRLRIAIKKWRYLLEILGQVCDQDYGKTLELLKEYQTVLGSLNDLVAFNELCSDPLQPSDEQQAVRTALAKETEELLEKFVQLAASYPLHYIFLL